MILTATGYTTGEIQVKDTDYGKTATVSIRCKSGNGKQSYFVNAVFYGKKIELAQRYINQDGRQVTITGLIKNVLQKESKKDNTPYYAIYMDGFHFTIPENSGPGEERYASKRGSSVSDEDVAF
jgi:hypothetical protein